MAEGHVCGSILPRKFWNLKSGNAISCILSIQIFSKIYANYTCIWNKRRKKRTKNKIIINNNLSLLSGRKTWQFKSILLSKDKG
jgi:hypothetical protein